MNGKKAILIFVIGALILAFAVNPQFRKKITKWGGELTPSSTSSSIPELNMDKFGTKYQYEYVPSYLWKKYGHKKVKVNIPGELGPHYIGNDIEDVNAKREIYQFTASRYRSMGTEVGEEGIIYLIDNTSKIREALDKYTNPKFEIVGFLENEKISLLVPFNPLKKYENIHALTIVPTKVKIKV